MLPINLAAFFVVVNVSTTLKQGFWIIAALQFCYILYRNGITPLLRNKYFPYVALLTAGVAFALVRIDYAFLKENWKNIIYPSIFFLGYFLISDNSSQYTLFKPFKSLRAYDREPENRFLLFLFFLTAAVDAAVIYGFLNYRQEDIAISSFHGFSFILASVITPILVLELCALFLKLYRNRHEFLFILFSAILGVLGLIATTSRISIVTILFTIFCLGVYEYKWKKGIVITAMAAIVFAALILGALKFLPLHPRLYKKAAEIHNFTDPRTSTGWRFVLWKESVKVFKAHPLMGVGHKQLSPYLNALTGQYMSSAHAHNMALQMLAEHGLLGFLFAAALALRLFWAHLSAALKRSPYGVMGVLLFMNIMIEGVTGIYPIGSITALLWLLNGVLVKLGESAPSLSKQFSKMG